MKLGRVQQISIDSTPAVAGAAGLKFVQKLVHCCNWLLTETQCEIISVQHVCRPKLFKNLCLSLVSGVPPLLFRTTPLLLLRCKVYVTVGHCSVCMSVCPVDRQPIRCSGGQLVRCGRTGYRSISADGARTAAAGSVMLRAEVRGSTKTC